VRLRGLTQDDEPGFRHGATAEPQAYPLPSARPSQWGGQAAPLLCLCLLKVVFSGTIPSSGRLLLLRLTHLLNSACPHF